MDTVLNKIGARTEAFTAGLFFAVLQMSYFFSLQILLSSSIITYFIVFITWITGTIAGLFLKLKYELLFIIISVSSFYIFFITLNLFPYNMELFPVYFALIFCSSFYTGHFFRSRVRLFRHAGLLLYTENNGFITGLILSTIGFVFIGKWLTVAAPGILFSVLVIFMYRNFKVNKTLKG